jgi:NADPH-ferrihemoprotein reductase
MNLYNTLIKQDQRDVLELLELFPSCKPSLAHFLPLLPKLQPRYYSISSSQKHQRNIVSITSVVVEFKTPTGRTHKGVASSYLALLIPTNEQTKPKIRAFFRRSSFKLPRELSIPIIMIGPGTGIAPFRGFIQERTADSKDQKLDPDQSLLFFGCRERNKDFLYKEELSEHHERNQIKLYTAFSREQQEKIYVTHRLQENEDLVWKLLQNGGFLYVCGDAKGMAKSVQDILKEIVKKNTCVGETEEEREKKASEYLKQLTQSERFQQDVW